MKKIIILVTLMVSACRATTVTSPASNTKYATLDRESEITEVQVKPKFLISGRGIGKAKLGMTVGELKRISNPDTEFKFIPSFMSDFDAIAVSNKGIVQYYIPYLPDEEQETVAKGTIADDYIITSVITDNSDYQTPQGVKVGTLIKEAEAIYGDAILAYNTEGESREYITFGNKNPENISFRASYFKLISDGLGFSGIYPEYPGVSYTTDKYRDDAAIAAIEVSCGSDQCSN